MSKTDDGPRQDASTTAGAKESNDSRFSGPASDVKDTRPELDLDGLVLDMSFIEMKRVGDRVRAPTRGMPSRRQLVRKRPGDDFCFPADVLEETTESGGRDWYLISNRIPIEARSGVRPAHLLLLMDRVGGLYVPPIWLSRPGGRWHNAANPLEQALARAEQEWIQLVWDRDARRYDWRPATIEIPEPAWPEGRMEDFISLAFDGRMISDPEHPALLAAMER